METNNKEIKVFISSTFMDLHNERSYLIENIYPKIEKMCWEKDIQFSFIDYRWGIPTELQKDDIIRMCLQTIGKCHPYFIGIIGKRYGSEIDPEEVGFLKDEFKDVYAQSMGRSGISITELEFIEGLLKHNFHNENAFCYKFSEEGHIDEDEDQAIKRNRFINTVLDSGYQFKNFASPEDLGKLVLQDFKNFLDKRPNTNTKKLSDKEIQQKIFIRSKTKCYLPDQNLQKKFEDYLDFENTLINKPLFLHGGPGCGKSAFVGFNTEKLEKEKPELEVITHFVSFEGAGNEKGVVEALTGQLLDILKSGAVDEDEEEQPEELVLEHDEWTDTNSKFIHFLSRTKRKIVFFIDGINQAVLNISDLKFIWIPPELPQNIRIVLTGDEDKALIALVRDQMWDCFEIPSFNNEMGKELIEKLHHMYNKALTASEYNAFLYENIEENKKTPLFITTVITEMVKIISLINLEKNDVVLGYDMDKVILKHEKLTDIIHFYMGLPNIERLFEIVLQPKLPKFIACSNCK